MIRGRIGGSIVDTPDAVGAGAWIRGSRRARARPKGRALDAVACAEVARILGDAPRRRDLLVEHLHRIQDATGCLSAAHLRALARELNLAQAEVWEVATFYAHFDPIREDETPPPPLTIRVCDSLSCAIAGAEDLFAELARGADPAAIRVVRAPCMGRCDTAPVAEVGHRHVDQATPETIIATVRSGAHAPVLPEYEDLERYQAGGGYTAIAALRGGSRTPEDVAETLLESGLRGLGGAGFPAGRKWGFVRAEAGPRYVAVNADEGEPGTFKDRYYLERTPHLFLEGCLIAAWAVAAERTFIYLRDEYPAAREILLREIAALEAADLVEPDHFDLRRGAGAYICGEESAMIESIEGKRGLPRHRPPFVAQDGIFGRPTLVHNVETLWWVARVLREGPDVLAAHGANGRVGLRSFSVSGRVREPGVKLAPAGITVRALIEEHCGGMAAGHSFKAYLPGGASGGILPASMGDIPLDFDTLQPHGCFIGSAAIIVLSDQDSVAGAAHNLLRFFADESCGQCTPCRVGCAKAVALMGQTRWDAPLLEELSTAMEDASICGLGQAAPNPIRSVLRHFPEEVSDG